jgi:hypothetical protein
MMRSYTTSAMPPAFPVINNYRPCLLGEAKKGHPDIGRPDFAMNWQTLFHAVSGLCRAGRLNAVCNTACTCDKASDRELRSALYVRSTQVTGYSSPEENRERAVFQVYTAPTIGGYCHTAKRCLCAAEEYHAISAEGRGRGANASTDRAAVDSYRGVQERLKANQVVEKAGIGSSEVGPGNYGYALTSIALEDIIAAGHSRAIVHACTAEPIVLDHIAF